MLKTIKKYIKSEIDLNRELTGYIRTGTAIGIAAFGAAVYLVAEDWAKRRRNTAEDDDRAKSREQEINELAGAIVDLGDRLIKLKLVSAKDVAEHGAIGALLAALRSIEPADLEKLKEQIQQIRASKG